MAKLSYHRLADAMVELLEKQPASEVAKGGVEYAMRLGQKLSIERLLPELERALFEHHGHAVVHITTARELAVEVTNLAAADLAESLESQSHEIINHIDPRILGGVVAEAAGRQRDRSVRRKLQYLGVEHG